MMSLTERSASSSPAMVDRGLRRLMGTVGIVLMATPTAELAVQLYFGERPHVMLLGGLFLVGLLSLSNALSRRAAPSRGQGDTITAPRLIQPHGSAVWPQDPSV